MTTPHQIGELLRTGVRPTEEETEHLTALGGFVAEMFGRYLDGRTPEPLSAGSDAWSQRLSSRLAASTAERWQHGFGLSDMLLDNALGGWWGVSQDGFASGYGEMDASMEVLSLFEEEVPEVAAAADGGAAPRRRGSLFGAKPAQARRPVARGARGKAAPAARPMVGDSQGGVAAAKPRAGRWGDGAIAELMVLKALAAGGLPVADQITEVLEGDVGVSRGGVPSGAPQAAASDAMGAPTRWVRRAPSGMGGRATERPIGQSVMLDGLRIDDRTPALASALARVHSVFGAVDQASPALNSNRLEAMTSAVKVSIDRGLGAGERPVYGFYDAVESTFLSLAPEASPIGATGGDAAAVAATGTARSVRPARSARVAAPSGAAGAQRVGDAPRASSLAASTSGAARAALRAPRSVSLDKVIGGDAVSRGLRPLTAASFAQPVTGVVGPAAQRTPTEPRAASAFEAQITSRFDSARSVEVATQVRYAPDGRAVPAVQRSSMGAPRMALAGVQHDSFVTPWTEGRSMSPAQAAATTTVVGSLPQQSMGVTLPGPFAREATGAFAQPMSIISTGAVASTSPIWRLAADGGPDMPLGAGFSRAEIFGATRAIAGMADIRAARNELRPIVSQPREEAAIRANSLSDALDGLVWVTAPAEPPNDGGIARASQEIQVTSVPRGRRAMMIPAGTAIAAIAQGALADRAFRTQSLARIAAQQQAGQQPQQQAGQQPQQQAGQQPQMGREAARVLSGQALSGQVFPGVFTQGDASFARADVPSRLDEQARQVTGFEGRAAEQSARIEALLRSGVLTTSGVPVARPAGRFGAGASVLELAAERRGADASVSDATAFAERIAPMTSEAGIAENVAYRGIGQAAGGEILADRSAGPVGAFEQRSLDIVGRLAQPGADLGRVAELAQARGIGARWLDAVVASGGESFTLARGVSNAMTQGYQSLDGDRVMLAIASELAAMGGSTAAVAEAITSRRAPRSVVRPEMGARQAARREALVRAAGGVSTGTAAPVVAAAATPSRSSTFEGSDFARAAEAASAGGSQSSMMSPGGRAIEFAAARQALLRPVVTARETRAVADVFGAHTPSLVGVMRGTAMSSTASGPVGAAGRSAVVASGSNEPVLSRLVGQMQAIKSAPGIAARWDVDGGIVERIASLGSGERAAFARSLADAGWTAPELQMLSLASGDIGQAVPASAAIEGGASAARPLASFSAGAEVARAEAAPAAARVGRMGQSLARVLSGAEALGGTVVGEDVGVAGRAAARMQASAWLPLLGSTGADKYFGGLAPSTTSRTTAYAALQDAVGELVRMAENAATTSDTAVSVEARREVLRRVGSVRSQVAEMSAASVARARGARGIVPSGAAAGGLGAQRDGGAALVPGRAFVGEGGGAAVSRDATIGARGDFAGSIDSGLVARVGLRADVDAAGATGGLVGAERADAGERSMRFDDVERTMVSIASEEKAQGGSAERMSSPSGLERRLAEALTLSAAGPAGARRLVRPLAGSTAARPVAPAAPRLRRGEVAPGLERVSDASIERAPVQAGRRADSLSAAVREEAGGLLPIGLGRVLAPEVMLSGLRSAELAKAVSAVATRQAVTGWDAVGVLTTLGDSGVDFGAARSSSPETSSASTRKSFAGLSAAELGRLGVGGSELSPRVQAMIRDAGRLGGATQRALLEVLSGGDAAQAVARSGLGKKERAGFLSAVLRGTERAERSSLLEQAGGSDFAFAWLARVDGTRSGLDIGLGETKAEFGRTFGKRRDSALAGASPMQAASLVGPARTGATSEDKSGLRSVAGQFAQTSTGAARPHHGASEAMRRTDWRFVETGSRASTAHADLGKLAAAIVGNSETGRRAPMPLVAPAAKAVAQTALRKPSSESVAAHGGGGRGGGGGGQKAAEPKLSEQAIESLAIEMASRVARLMGLMKERIGVW